MKINQEQLGAILEDLYAVDPKLSQYEAELAKIIQQLVEFRPEANFDETFKLQLKEQLLQRAAQLQAASGSSEAVRYPIFGGKFSYALAGALVLVIVVAGAGYFAQKQGLISWRLPSAQKAQVSETTHFKKIALNENAFGSLISGGITGDTSNGSAPQPATLGLGGDGGGISSSVAQGSGTVAPSTVRPSVIVGKGGGGGIGIMPSPVYFKYVYTGAALDLKDTTVEVLRRVGFNEDVSGLGGLLNSFGLGMVNMSSFSSLKVQSINLVENKDLGYNISASPQDGTIYISQNWLKWPQPYATCAGSVACVDQNRMKISDVISGQEAIDIAADFVASHSINTDSYGAPEVTDDSWRVAYAETTDKSQFYIPEQTNVLYPLLINGQTVYDEGGNKTGMNVSIDMRQKKVSGVGNITSQTYQASNYVAETDSAKILRVVESGGYWGYNYMSSSGAKEMVIEVGTPSAGYVSMSNYDNATGQNTFLLVPALIFPVTKTPNDPDYYYQKTIVVPLAKELLSQRLQPPVPVPMMKNSSGGAVDSVPLAPQQ